MSNKPKVGLFFGAGAEIAYGLPSGGRFALDIFRMDAKEDKAAFKEKRNKINSRSPYAAKWLPNDYQNRSVSTFGKSQYESLIISSLENKRSRIIAFLNDFDAQAKKVLARFDQDNIDIDQHLASLIGKNVGEEVFTHDVKLNDALGARVDLFSSNYFSALLKVVEEKSSEEGDWIEDLKNIIRSFIELLIGAIGEDFLHNINDSIFEKKPDSIDIFDDFVGYFKFDYKRISGLEYIVGKRFRKITETMESGPAVTEFARRILEEIFVVALDYQSLIDNNYRYLFSPKTDWPKFCKMAIFLMTVRRYITRNLDEARKTVMKNEGYYQDINKLAELCNIKIIGTTNYNTFVDDITNLKAVYLNGSIHDFYDPYRNKIISEDEEKQSKHLCVPFLFTQSGIKPMTSVSMSRRYVDLFDNFTECDVIGVVGFSFQADDGHVNGLFRELIEDAGKKVVIFHHESETDARYDEKIRLSKTDNLIVETIGDDRTCGGKLWIDKLIGHAAESGGPK